ncbi:hypothetical protein V1478_002008 [Vespula squamosa]|uniref:Uncharacterized protein n=1 Tax=Vespula squamosa TaxID=30214 RepID=A0ABD2BYR1_VESSQ
MSVQLKSANEDAVVSWIKGEVECIAMDDARNKVVVDRVAAISAKDTDRNPRVPTRPTKGPAHTVSSLAGAVSSIDATAAAAAAVGFKFRGRPSVDQVDDRRSFARVDDSAEGKIRKRGWKARHSRLPWAAATVTATALQPPPIPTTHRGRRRTTCATLFMVRRALDVIVADDSDDDEGVDLMDKEEVGIRRIVLKMSYVCELIKNINVPIEFLFRRSVQKREELKFEKHVKGHNARGRATCLSKYSTRYGSRRTMPVGIESERRREEPTGNAKGQGGRIEEEEEEEEEAHHGPSYSAVFREGRSSKDEGSNVLVGLQTYLPMVDNYSSKPQRAFAQVSTFKTCWPIGITV